MNSININLRRAGIVLVTLAASCAIAACGSSKSTSTTAASSSGSFASRRAAFVACMKQHGVTIPNHRPSGAAGGSGSGGAPGAGGPYGAGGGPGAGGGFPGARAGGFFGGASNPKFAAAFKACGSTLGAGRFGGRGHFRGFRINHTAINNYVACIRKHGYNMPSPNFSGSGPVFPSRIRTNKKFQTASASCAHLLVRPGGYGGAPPGGVSPGASGTSTSSSS